MKNGDDTKEEFQKMVAEFLRQQPKSVILDIFIPPEVAELLEQEMEFEERLYAEKAKRASEAVKQVDKEILEYIEPTDVESLSEYNRKKLEEVRKIVEEASKDFIWGGQEDGPEEPMV